MLSVSPITIKLATVSSGSDKCKYNDEQTDNWDCDVNTIPHTIQKRALLMNLSANFVYTSIRELLIERIPIRLSALAVPPSALAVELARL